MVGCQYAGTTGLYEHTYRGVFASPFDYDMALYDSKLAKIVLKYGGQITEEQKIVLDGIDKLESLGGIQKPIDMSVAERELQDFIKSKRQLF